VLVHAAARLLPGETKGEAVPNEYDDEIAHGLLAADDVKNEVDDDRGGRVPGIEAAGTERKLEVAPAVDAAELCDCETNVGSGLEDRGLHGTAYGVRCEGSWGAATALKTVLVDEGDVASGDESAARDCCDDIRVGYAAKRFGY
jgi:hypothetical protein